MAQTPSYYINSPTSGTRYTMPAGYYVQPNSSTTVLCQVTAWSGPNGTGSHVTCTSMTSWTNDESTGVDKGTFTGSSVFSVASQYSSPNGTDFYTGAGSYSGGTVGSLEIYLTYTGAAVIPFNITFTPSIAAPGSTVAISGNNFNGATIVQFNGVNAASFTVNNDISISATVPNGATAGLITVGNPQGSNTSAATFTPSSIYADDGSAFQQAVVAYADNGTSWQQCQVWVDNGTAWVQIA